MPPRTPRPPSLLAQPAYLASQVSRYARRGFEAALSEHRLRVVHYGILAALDDFGPLAQQQLADSLDHDKSHLVRHIDDLEHHGLVTRGPDPADRRRNQVALTSAGRKLLHELRAQERRSQQGFLNALSPDEQRTLQALLRRLVDANDGTRPPPKELLPALTPGDLGHPRPGRQQLRQNRVSRAGIRPRILRPPWLLVAVSGQLPLAASGRINNR